MKFSTKTLGQEVTLDAPDTPGEFDNLIGQKDACLNTAIKHAVYHTWHSKFRTAFAQALEENSSIKRQQIRKGNALQFELTKDGAKGAPIMESEQAYVNRVEAEEYDPTEITRIAHEVAALIPFDPTPSRKTKKPLARHLTAATAIMTRVDDEETTSEEVIAKFESNNNKQFTSIGDGEWNIDNLAQAVRINEDRKIKEGENEF